MSRVITFCHILYIVYVLFTTRENVPIISCSLVSIGKYGVYQCDNGSISFRIVVPFTVYRNMYETKKHLYTKLNCIDVDMYRRFLRRL